MYKDVAEFPSFASCFIYIYINICSSLSTLLEEGEAEVVEEEEGRMKTGVKVQFAQSMPPPSTVNRQPSTQKKKRNERNKKRRT